MNFGEYYAVTGRNKAYCRKKNYELPKIYLISDEVLQVIS